MNITIESKKQKALELMKTLDIYKPYNAPFFYAELRPEIDRKINLKLARILRRWQLGVACLDTSRLGCASPKTSHA